MLYFVDLHGFWINLDAFKSPSLLCTFPEGSESELLILQIWFGDDSKIRIWSHFVKAIR